MYGCVKGVGMKNKGFSLTEWVVCIVAAIILIAIAVPSYKSYATKRIMRDINKLLQQQFNSLAERHTNGQNQPITLNNPLPTISSLVSTPTSTGGTVVVHFEQNAVLNQAFVGAPVIATYTATKSNGVVTWSCGPLTSTGTISHEDRVIINSKYLTKPQCS